MTLLQALKTVFTDLHVAIQTVFTPYGLLWLGVTIACYIVAVFVHRKASGSPLLHPLILTTLFVGVVLFSFGLDVGKYQNATRILQWLLGLATVALAIPLFNSWQVVREAGGAMVLSIFVGGVIAPVTAWGAMWLLDAPLAMQLTMLTKSITTPLAMETSANIGGVPALAAVFVIITGVIGAVLSPLIFKFTGTDNHVSQGVALGTIAHAVGTSRAIHMHQTTGAIATASLCINGIMTSLILPIVMLALK